MGIIPTKHGIIDEETKCYITHRKPHHFFIKFQGFGISFSEVDFIIKSNVQKILIIYDNRINYIFDVNKLKDCEEYNDDGDKQYIIPKKKLQKENK